MKVCGEVKKDFCLEFLLAEINKLWGIKNKMQHLENIEHVWYEFEKGIKRF